MSEHICIGKRVELRVRDTPCRQHPDEEWLELVIDGQVVLSNCTGAIRANARIMRGKDLISFGKASREPDSQAEGR